MGDLTETASNQGNEHIRRSRACVRSLLGISLAHIVYNVCASCSTALTCMHCMLPMAMWKVLRFKIDTAMMILEDNEEVVELIMSTHKLHTPWTARHGSKSLMYSNNTSKNMQRCFKARCRSPLVPWKSCQKYYSLDNLIGPIIPIRFCLCGNIEVGLVLKLYSRFYVAA